MACRCLGAGLALALIAALTLSAVQAQTTYFWDGGDAGNNSWGAANNWNPNVVPTFNNQSILNFNNTNRSTSVLGGADRTVRSIVFGADMDSDFSIGFWTSPNTVRNLTMDTDVVSGSASINVLAGATGNFTLGVNAGSTAYGNLVLADNLEVDHNGTGTLLINRPITGAFSVTKSGSGTMVLSGTNTYTGNTVISQGVLQITNTGSIATNGSVQISSGATFLVTRVNANLVLSNAISGAGALTKAGAATLTLGGANAYTGGTTILGGSLISGTNGALGTGALTIDSAAETARLNLNGTTNTVNNLTLLGAVADRFQVIQNERVGADGRLIIDLSTGVTASSTNTVIRDGSASNLGTLALTKNGAGTLDLTILSSIPGGYTGGLTVNDGTVRFSRAIALGFGNIILAGGSLDYNANTDLTVTNAVALSNTVASMLTNAAGHVTFSGNISGTGSLLKSGAGTTTLSGSNSFTGATAVTGGILNLNSSAGSSLGSTTSVSVTNATLLISQSGQVSSTAAVSLSGGTIQRGAGAGVSEVFGSLNVSTGSFLDFGTGAVGNLTFGTYQDNAVTPSALLTLNNFLPGNSFTFSSTSFTTNSVGNYFTFGTGYAGSSIAESSGTFTITAIPEPSTYLAAAGLLAVLLWPSRRRLLKDAKSVLGLRRPLHERSA